MGNSIADVAQFDIAAYPEFGSGCHAQAQRLFTSAGFKPRVFMHVFHRQTMLVLVQLRAGIAIIPGSFVGVAGDGDRVSLFVD